MRCKVHRCHVCLRTHTHVTLVTIGEVPLQAGAVIQHIFQADVEPAVKICWAVVHSSAQGCIAVFSPGSGIQFKPVWAALHCGSYWWCQSVEPSVTGLMVSGLLCTPLSVLRHSIHRSGQSASLRLRAISNASLILWATSARPFMPHASHASPT